MKQPKIDYINDESDAATFYYTVVVENGIVINADNGFFRNDGEPALRGMSLDNLQELQACHEKAKAVLLKGKVDAQEIIDYCESMLVIQLVTGIDAAPEACPARVIKNIENETDEEKYHRRCSHLWHIFGKTVQASTNDGVFDEQSMGFALPKDSHPVLSAYIKNVCDRLPVESHSEMVVGSPDEDEVRAAMRKKAEELGMDLKNPIDPDSDENDDDPFSSGMWA
tara:strand:- start:128 stop:802 length:675 start_codon:yes stop_codon:yes gene_type:complete